MVGQKFNLHVIAASKTNDCKCTNENLDKALNLSGG